MSAFMLDHGSFYIKQSPANITIVDGSETIKAPFSGGKVTYCRSRSGGVLYINGEEAGRHYGVCEGSSDQCFYYGEGSISCLRMHTAAF